MNLVLIGPPGVGKGTYADELKKYFSIPKVCAGDILREEAGKNTSLGKKIKSSLEKGRMVDPNIIIPSIKKRISKPDCRKGFLLDGFPRDIKQAKSLKKFAKIDAALFFNAKKSTLIKRLSGRRTCSKCNAIYHIKNMPPKKKGICDKCGGKLYQRDDEKPEVTKTRLKIYEKQTKPVIDFYKKEGLLKEIDAEGNADDIVDYSIRIIKSLSKTTSHRLVV